ncbi:MAG: GGDEF domain-containing protein [Lachnospiraceae bacterium]|nr:GGDEF domain-containing protein [Lachnospiraceae bacterium]
MNIGILIGNIYTTHTDDLLNGILHGAEREDVQTIFFMGAHANCFDELYYFDIDDSKTEKYLFQFNTVFDYANLGKLDLLIVAYSTFYLYMGESKEDFFKRFKNLDIPMLVIGDEYADYTNVISDNADGIRKCMEHLVDCHGCKKIGFLGGPKENNKDARERLDAYLSFLNERDLPIESSLIEYGDYSANSAKLFGRILDNNPDIDGIVCANDTMALSGYEECKLRGLVPGVDIAITGFDDIQEAKSAMPALTTVEQNTYDLGYMAINKAIDMLQNGDYSSAKAPVYFKHRESCGSGKEILHSKPLLSLDGDLSVIAENMSEDILRRVSRYKSSIADEIHVHEVVKNMFLHVLTVYASNNGLNYDIEYLDLSMRELIRSEKINSKDFQTEFGHKISDIMFSQQNKSRRAELSDIMLHMLDVSTSTMDLCAKDQVDNLQRNIWTTPFITRELITHIDDEKQMYCGLMERLRFMRIENAYLFLLPEPVINNKISDWSCPEELDLMCKIENGIISYVGKRTKLNKENGLMDIIEFNDCSDIAMYSLFSDKANYGLLVCQMTPDNITSMYSVSLHIGSAFQFIALTKKQREIQGELEQAMILLKNKNEILSMISEKDELTGLYNRRGFIEKAINRMAQAKNCYLLCLYADLDHLKQINDQFGHQEGDFAISKAAEYLRASLRSTDIIGRIGGDEFAALAIISREDLGKSICNRIVAESKMFNQGSDKPYYVELSIGYSVNKWSPDLELNKMLSAADLMLYENKAKRRKDASKSVIS